jgi:hypothetical protein
VKSIFGLRGRRLALVTVAIFAVAGGIAYASIPDATGVYHACMLKNIGTIRIIDLDKQQHCVSALETEITFNQKGQKGDQGLQGTPGQPGTNGQNGTNGSNGSNGAPGISPTVTQLAVGDSNCPAGGAAITGATGPTAYVCSGLNGQNGQNGQPGADGQPFSGTFTSPNGQYSISVTDTGVTVAHGASTFIRLSANDVTVRSDTMSLLAGTDFTVRAGTGFDVSSGAGTRIRGNTVLSLQGSLVTLNGGSCAPAARLGDTVSSTVGGGFAFGSITTGSGTVCIGN